MNPTLVDELVAASLNGERSVYAHHVPDPKEYVESIHRRFLSQRIVPTLRAITIQPYVAGLLELPVGTHSVYFVSEGSPHNVFYDPFHKSFGAAWGPDAETGEYLDLGFRSADVLEMASA